ncbi:MAG: hypothetical protein Q8R82_07140 [Hyphomonadaceae bacterium]|nr:hypothetical protein [Hyphomonadaceae bacterium]
MIGFLELPCLSGPALIRLDRVVLVRPDPTAAATRTLIVLDGAQEVLITKPAAEVVSAMKAV